MLVTNRSDIREVIAEFDTTAKSTLFGSSKAAAKGEGGMDFTELGPDGSPVAMQIEMQKEAKEKTDKGKAKKGGAGAGGSKKASGGGKKGGAKKK